MGFFAEGAVAVEPRGKTGQPSTRLLHQLECSGCPLSRINHHSPKMLPTGAVHPKILCLGEAPGEQEDLEARQFVGASGKYLRPMIPREWRDLIRWDNVARCRPPDNATPDNMIQECCRPRHVRDVEETRPKAIFGFGAVPLHWALDENGINNWRGRRVPVKIGNHSCWYFPFHHPAYLLRARQMMGRGGKAEIEHIFALDLKRAFAAMEGLSSPFVHDRAIAMEGIESVLSSAAGDAQRVIDFLRWASAFVITGVDFETSGMRPYRPEAKIISIAVSANGRAMAFPYEHPKAKWTEKEFAAITDAWLDFITVQDVRKAVHNLSFEHEWTAVTWARELLRASRWDDTMSQAFVLDQRPGGKSRGEEDGALECLGLGFLTKAYFGFDIKSLYKVDRKRMIDLPLETLLPYNAVDAKYHAALCIAQDDALEAADLTHVYENQLRRIPTVVLTQVRGVPLDLAAADELREDYTTRIAALLEEIKTQPIVAEFRRRTGKAFNPGSNPAMTIMCRDILKSTAGRTAMGGYSVGEEVLSKIDHPLMKLVLALRTVSKLNSTYVFDRTSPVVYPDSRLHPLLNSCRAATSRLTSSEPNEQNIPLHTEEGKKIRKQVHADARKVLVSLDYGQIEARIFAWASLDKRYTKVWWEGYDIHMDWAKRIAMAYPEKIGGKKFLTDAAVMKTLRQEVKSNWVFSSLFGASLQTNADNMRIPIQYLQPIFRDFWREFAGIKAWHEEVNKFYAEHGYVEMLTGRRRYGPLDFNQIINTPIQGTMAEFVINAMDRISEWEIEPLQPIFNIHDDLTFELEAHEIDKVLEPIIGEMLRPDHFDFINTPIMVEMSVGEDWQHKEEVAKYKSTDWWPELHKIGAPE